MSSPKKRRLTSLGRQSEALAAAYLRSQGYEILETNYRGRRGEIDIVARYQQIIIFVEVKGRRSLNYGLPEESITPEKRRRLSQTALEWLKRNKGLEALVRFDVVTIVWEDHGPRINHIQNAFQVSENGS